MAKPATRAKTANPPAEAETAPPEEKFRLPIAERPGRSAGGQAQPWRLMIVMALILALIAALIVWWLGRNL